MASSTKSAPNFIIRFFKETPLRYTVTGGIAIVAFVLVGGHFLTRTAAPEDSQINTASVTLASVASLSSQSGPLPVTGTVTSLHEATILAQNGGEIVQVYNRLGDSVGAGQIIARL